MVSLPEMPGCGVIEGLVDTAVVMPDTDGEFVGAGAATVVSVAAGAAVVAVVAAAGGAAVVAVASAAELLGPRVAVAAGGALTGVPVGVSPPQAASMVASSTKIVASCKAL